MSSSFRDLVELVSKLRSPGGCPWDRQQTHHSLKPMMLEEAYEVIEAIEEGDDHELMEELGDLLLQVVFHSQIASEEGRFTIDDVIRLVSSKMVRRHPHVFGQDQADTPDQVLRNWEALKEAELAAKGKQDGSMLDSVSSRQPAIMEAFQMTSKVSRVGFDWPSTEAALEKLHEELNELKRAIALGDDAQIAHEIGDLLFMVVNVARILGVDPESALKASNRKFRRRFRYIEDRLRERGLKPANATPEEMDVLWEEAKQHDPK
jgi:tetrapyrrole methylase family protein/MazG family protein